MWKGTNEQPSMQVGVFIIPYIIPSIHTDMRGTQSKIMTKIKTGTETKIAPPINGLFFFSTLQSLVRLISDPGPRKDVASYIYPFNPLGTRGGGGGGWRVRSPLVERKISLS